MILALLVACSMEAKLSSDAHGPSAASEDAPDASVEIRVDVHPSSVREGAAEALRALPASSLHELEPARDLALGVVALPTPQRQPGSVVAYQLSPSVAAIPGEEVPVAGTVYIERPGTLQRYAARTDDDGGFEAWVVPDQDYRLQVVPDDPMLPMYAGDLAVGARPEFEALDLGAGVPIYGVVSSELGPVAGARVSVESVDGHRSTSAVADLHGIYQIRVTPGAWTVVSLGRGLNQDPILRRELVEVGEAGAQVDFAYPTALSQVLVEGRLTDPNGDPVAAATVRLRATELDGYQRIGSATWSVEVPIADNGTFLARVVPGEYVLEALPEDGSDHAPASLQVSLSGLDNDLGNIVMPDLVPFDVNVVDVGGTLLVGARVTCVETGFDGHTFTGFTTEEGAARLRLPPVEVACEIAPPGDRAGLAARHAVFVPEARQTRSFDLLSGQLVSGVVEIDGAVEPFAVVEVRGPDDLLLGFDLTDEKGAFEIHVDLR